MGQGITGWRLHVGVIFPTPVPPRPIREWYEVVPDGVDITTVSLTIQQLTDDNMEEALSGMERAAKQLANFDVDVIYQSGVPPIVARGTPGFANEVQDRLEQASGLPCITDMAGVIEAMHSRQMRSVAMATPFRQFINDRLVKYLAQEQITVSRNIALGIVRNTESAGCRSRSSTRPRAGRSSRRRAGRTASTSPAAAGARCTTSSRWSRTSTPRW